MTRRPVLPLLVLLDLLAACAAPAPMPTPTPLPLPTATPTAVPPTPTPTPAPLPYSLAEPGPYPVGLRNYLLRDPARKNKVVTIALYYPALAPAGATPGKVLPDAKPDLSGAPYPVLLAAAKEAGFFGIHLASYGMAFVGIDPQDNSPALGPWLIEYSRDHLFALDRIAAGDLAGTAGLLDPNKAGVLGYSFDSTPPLQLSGARMDPAFFLSRCAEVAEKDPDLYRTWVVPWGICVLAERWADWVALAGPAITESSDGLWQPLADPRIRAVMPMAPDIYWLFGPDGLAAVDRPMLLLANSDDVDSPYHFAVDIADAVPPQFGVMITFVGKGHNLILDEQDLGHIRHLMVAFFGYHLLGRQDYAPLFSEEFVKQHPELAWGAYPPQ